MNVIPKKQPGLRHYQWHHLIKTPGAYLIYKDRRCYVGSSKNLHARLLGWVNHGRFAGWRWRAWPDENYKRRERKLMEALLAENVKLLNKNYSTF